MSDSDDSASLKDLLSDLEDTVTISVAGDNMSSSIYTTNWMHGDCDVVTMPASSTTDTYTFDPLTFGDILTTSDVIQVGKRKLTQDKMEKLDALLDLFESDPEFAEKLNTQIAFNRIKNNDQSESD